MVFNPNISLYKNIQNSLVMNGSSLESTATAIGTTKGTLTTSINKTFKRASKNHPKGKSTPLDKKIFNHLESNCLGFKQFCLENEIQLVS